MFYVLDVCVRIVVNVFSHLINKWLDSKHDKDS
uniref:Uncharacterized protein n=1 Tax=Enterococcus faecium TaxID=1352 RepID=E3UST1_ENTFC|nr:hypothetical protein pLG1-0028 [Enterococcus faecium]